MASGTIVETASMIKKTIVRYKLQFTLMGKNFSWLASQLDSKDGSTIKLVFRGSIPEKITFKFLLSSVIFLINYFSFALMRFLDQLVTKNA